MKVEDIKKICVVGAGNMGHQIALSAALAGYKVSCTDISLETLGKAENFACAYLPERVAKGKMTQERADLGRVNLSFTQNLEDAAGDADFVIEAAVEKIDIKRKLFADLDRIAPPHAILATNSSFIVSSKIVDETFRLMDFTGIDLAYYIGMERYQETGDPKDKPSPLVVEKFAKGEWGMKTKKGFYSYE